MEKVQDALNPGHQKDDAILYQTTDTSTSHSKEATPGPAESKLTPTESPQSESKKSSGGLKSKIDSLKSKFSSNKDSKDSKDSESSKERSPSGTKSTSEAPVVAGTTTTTSEPHTSQRTAGADNTLGSDLRPSAPPDAASAASIKSGVVGEPQSGQKLAGNTSTDPAVSTSAHHGGDTAGSPTHSKAAATGAGVGALGAAGIATHDSTTRDSTTRDSTTRDQPAAASSFSPIHRNVATTTTTQPAVSSTQHTSVPSSTTHESALPSSTGSNPSTTVPEDHTTRNTALGAAGLAGGAYAGSKAFGSNENSSTQPGQAITTDKAIPQSSTAQPGGTHTPTDVAGTAVSSETYTARSFALASGQEPPKESGYPSPAGNTFGNYGTTAPLRGDGIVPENTTSHDGGFTGMTAGSALGQGGETTNRGTLQRLDSEPLAIPGSFPAATPLHEEPRTAFPTSQDVGVGPGAATAAATAASGNVASRDASKPSDSTSHVHPAASTQPAPQADREHHHGRDAAIVGGSGAAAIAAAEAYRRHDGGEPSSTRGGVSTVESAATPESSKLTPNQQIYGTQAVGGVDDVGASQKTTLPAASSAPTATHGSSDLTPNQQIYGTQAVGGVDDIGAGQKSTLPAAESSVTTAATGSSDLTPNQKIYGASNVGSVDSIGQGATPAASTSESSKLSPNQQIYGTAAVGGPDVVDRKTTDSHDDHTKRNAALGGAAVLGAGGAGAAFASSLRDDDTTGRTGPSTTSAYDAQRATAPTTTHHATHQPSATTGATNTSAIGAGPLGTGTTERDSTLPSSTYPIQAAPTGAHPSTQDQAKDHHHGRDAALAGGALGAAGAGAYAIGKSDNDRAVPSSTHQTPQPSHTTVQGTHDSTHDQLIHDQRREQHHGRDAALYGGAGAGAVGAGVGAHALGRSDDDRTHPVTAHEPTTSGHGFTQTTHDSTRDPATQTKESDHTKEKLAAGGLGAGALAGAGAYGVHESKEQEAAQRAALEKQAKEQQRESEHAAKQAEKDAKEAKKEHAKEEKKAEKEHAKEEKKAEKEHAKEEKKAEKEAHKEHEKHEKVLAKQREKDEKEAEKLREKQEKEAEKERKKAEKEAEKEKKGGLLGFLHRDKDKDKDATEEEETEEERRRKQAAAGGAAAVGGAGAYAAYNAHSQDTDPSQQRAVAEDRREPGGINRGESQTSEYSRGSQDTPNRGDSPGGEKKSRGLGGLFHRKDKNRSSVDEDRSSPVVGESSTHGTPDRTASGGYAAHEGRNKLHKDPPKDYYEKQGVTPPQRSSLEQGPISGIHEPGSIPGAERTDRADEYRGAPIGNTPQKVTEPITGLPMNVGGQYGVGEGGTDANANIPGYRAPQ